MIAVRGVRRRSQGADFLRTVASEHPLESCNGETIKIAASKMVAFKPRKVLKAVLISRQVYQRETQSKER